MALESRIRELDARHKTLEEAIRTEMRAPASDPVRVSELKRQKLKLKDEIAALLKRAQH